MKTFLQTLFLFLLATQLGFAQWYQQNSGTTKNLYAVRFTDANNGFAVGDSGIILRTTDGGNDWLIQPSETILPLNDIFFLDANNGWIVGGTEEGGGYLLGILLRTSDGGATWYKLLEDSIDSPSSIFFNDTLNGWCVGYKIRRTTDGGINWSEIIGLTWEIWSDVYFKNLDTGIVVGVRVGEGRGSWPYTIETSDGGLSWFGGDLPGAGAGTSLNSLFLIGSDIIITVGGSIVAKTSDWGITWVMQSIPNIFSLNDVYFVNDAFGWTVGGDSFDPNGQYSPKSNILRTTDSGETWSIQWSDTLNVFSGVFFTDILYGWVVGDRGAIFRTTNGGVSFVEEEQLGEVPTEFLLSQNWPNPFNPSTKIKYSIPQSSNVVIKVFDLLGNEIETLVNEEKPAGTYEVNWTAENLPSGVYFYQLKAGDFVQTKKMILMK